MKTMKWMAALLMASALCTACESKKETPKVEAKKPEATMGAVKPMPYDANMVSLAHRSNCFSCHAIDQSAVGPSFKDVAARYSGHADAEEKLVAKVANGGSGVWGSVPMPPSSPGVKDEDIRTLVKFILSLT